MRRAAQFLAQVEILPVGLAGLCGMLYTPLLPAALGIAAAWWLVRWAAWGKPSLRTAADLPIFLLGLLLILSLWVSAVPEITWVQVLRTLLGAALYYSLVNWTNTTNRLRWVLGAFLAACLALALGTPFTVSWVTAKFPAIPGGLYERFVPAVADLANPNVMAGTLVLLLPLGLAGVLYPLRPVWLCWLAGLAFAAGAAVMVLLQSRGGLMALAAVVLLLVSLRWRWGWLSLPAASAVGVVAVSSVGFPQVLALLVSSPTLGGMEGRLEVWRRAVYLIQDFPFTGVGLGAFSKVIELLYPFPDYLPDAIPHAHNLFLQVGADLGIPGLLAWLWVFGLVCAACITVFRHGKRTGDPVLLAVGAGLLGSQLAVVVHGLTDAVVWGMVRPAPLLWALWGAAAAAVSEVRRAQG